MKAIKKIMVTGMLALAGVTGASAQYYQMVNQATDMLSTALLSGANYRGFADVSYLRGLGTNRADLLEITTTQGAQFNNWFYMGLGAGVDVMFAYTDDIGGWTTNHTPPQGLKTTACMIPLYSDFRFDIGRREGEVNFFIDLRLGASFLIGKSYLELRDGYINQSECFYMKPSVGFRVPLSTTNTRLAMNVAASYTLVATDYWSYYDNDVTLNNLGVTVGIEW